MSRREEVADAAISTLARHGMRGLTHRAVDRAAGLPESSTVYYFRTRQALLQAAVERLVDLDLREIPQLSAGVSGFVDEIAELLHRSISAQRERQLARYELTLEATRRPELREALVAGGARIRAAVADRLQEAGIPAAERRARDFVACFDGVLLDEIAGDDSHSRTPADLRQLLGAVLTAITED